MGNGNHRVSDYWTKTRRKRKKGGSGRLQNGEKLRNSTGGQRSRDEDREWV